MQRFLVFAYGVLAYAVFFGTFLYMIGFIGNLFVPKSIDSVPQVPLATAAITNIALLAIFALQHSAMARPAFKRWITRFMPASMERSTYVLASSAALMLLFAAWQPMGGVIWYVENTALRGLLYAVFGMGWLLVLSSTFLINHFDLFGLRQVWLNLCKKPYTPLKFGTPLLYRLVRHPLYLGFLMAIWATPVMTAAHLLLAIGLTAYIFMGIRLEEKDLVDALPEYEEYRRQVPMILPVPKRKDRTAEPNQAQAGAA